MGSRSRLRSSMIALSALTLSAALASAQVFVVGEKTAEADVNTEFHPTHVQLPAEPLSQAGYLDLIRNLESEQGFAHRELPLGAGIVLIANGNMTPNNEQYKQILYKKGESAAAGERVAVTSLHVDHDRIILDINGGPYARHRFLSHISLNDMPLAQQAPLATGARITLVFEGGVPDVTAAEVKALLDPLIDFRARSSSEAFANTLPPLAKEAVATHQILVGMDQRTVIASVGAPKEKQHEHTSSTDPNSPVLEEWIYGEPPVPVQFVRFRNGRVIRLEIAALGKPLEIHDKNEMGADQTGPVLQARTILNGDEQRAPGQDMGRRRPPTLARPGEVLDSGAATMGKVMVPGSDCQTPAATRNATPSTPSASSSPASPATTPNPTNVATLPPCPDGSSQASTTKSQAPSSARTSTGSIGNLPSSDLPGDTAGGMGGPSTLPGAGPASPSSPNSPMNSPSLPGSGIPIGPQHASGAY